MDYFGSNEEVSILEFDASDSRHVGSALKNVEQIDVHINNTIRSISVVNEIQRGYRRDVIYQELKITRGIIFHFLDSELSFEKGMPFSEIIYINRGYNLIDKFHSVTRFSEGWKPNESGICTREIITLQ